MFISPRPKFFPTSWAKIVYISFTEFDHFWVMLTEYLGDG